MKRTDIFASLAGIALMAATMQTQAAFSDQDDRAFGGIMACGGNHFNRLGGTEAHRTRYILRNYADIPVRIESMKLYDANGNTLFDSSISGLPDFDAVLVGGNNILGPNQTALLKSETILTESSLPSNARPIQMIIEWAADSKTVIPDFVWVRNTLARQKLIDPVTGAVSFKNRESRGRHLNNCRSVRIAEGKGQLDNN